ncbi:MAG TPA: DUF1549 domain-containing protein, partial [Planctomycetaceae bacterium]|nr:DUF1549 domain-containing protein [Planctomycetaceae bacterium]
MKLAIRISLVGLHLLISTVALTAEEPQATSRPPVDFDRDVRPILSNHCFQCHGADADTREADLRLDLRSSAIEMEAIVPKDTDKSSLVTRISSTDPDERMPPADTNKPLSEKQIAILKQWVAEGADYKEHWAFQRVERPATPALPDSAWCRNEIDLFILQRLNAESLRPSEPADNETLIRRLYQDLLGLLPTVAETDAFLLDTSPDAYGQLVDRILSNPHYGERWGRHWLDQARYADSNGYTIDGPRVMWPYRDWVIHALNEDMPFDEFTIAQLAGDLLPEASLPQKVATGFHRNTMINEEGGVKADQFRHEAIIDRVNTTGAVWLGLTVGCAQCHSHKFDPVSHEEFYQLYAFFNACADANNLSETVAVKEGEIFGWSAEQQQKFSELQSLEKELVELQKTMKSARPLHELAWNWQPAKVVSASSSGKAKLTVQPDYSVLATKEDAANDAFTIVLDVSPAEGSDLTQITGVRLRTLPHASLPSMGPGTAGNGNFVLTDFSLGANDQPITFAAIWADHNQPDYPVENAVDDKPNTGWAINVNGAQAAMGEKMNAPHEAIFALSQPAGSPNNRLQVILRHDLNKAYLIGHFALDISTASVIKAEESDPVAI